MAEPAQDPSTRPPDFRTEVVEKLTAAVDAGALLRAKDWALDLLLTFAAKLVEWTLRMAIPLANRAALAVSQAEDANVEGFRQLTRTAILDMFGKDVGAGLNIKRGSGGNKEAANAIGDALLRAFSGAALDGVPSGKLEPSDEPAKNFLSAMAQISLEGWIEGWLVEALTLGQLESFGELDDTISHTLGLGRAAAAVHGPLVRHLIVEPLEWKINKDHRPTLLPTSTVLRQFTRGRWDWTDVEEELARQGYSSERIDALLTEQIKRLTPDDLSFLLWNELIADSEAIQTMREEGYDEQTASKHLNAQKIKREDAIRDDLASAALTAYVDRRIDDGQLQRILADSITSTRARQLMTAAARGRRALNTKNLSPAQVAQCVKVGILAVADYRAALAQDGYDDGSIVALELLLRHELDEKAAIDALRAQTLAERAAEQAAKQAAAAARRQEIAETQALRRRGSLAELERAVVLGLVPIGRLEEVLAAQFDTDTVQIYVADVEQQRAAHVAEQQRRDDAAKRLDNKGLNVGQLEQAVYAGVLTVDEFANRLGLTELDAADVDVLARTVAAKLADLTAARAKRAAAEQAATRKGLDLGRLEQLVLRGLRTFAEYDAQLEALGFDDAARAAMRELLQARVDEQAAAARLRHGIGAGDVARGLSLEQFRKAVIAGAKTLDEFQTYLVDEKYTTDAQAVLVDELASDVAAAAAAQQRRSQADAASGRAGVSVTGAARAARLGIITPAAYQAALEAAGYSADDVGLELALLVAEMATAKAAQKVEASTATPTSAHGLTLGQIAAAVKAGAATRADYQSAAAAAGLDDDAIATLTAQLDDELAAIGAAKGRRQQIVPALAAAGVDLADLENAVRQGALTVAAFEAQLVGYGYSDADAQLVGALLETELAAS